MNSYERFFTALHRKEPDRLPLIELEVERSVIEKSNKTIQRRKGSSIWHAQFFYNKIAVIGNIDCASLLTFGSPEDVERATIECIRKASSGGGHILSSSNIIHKGVPPENFLTMIDTAKKYGKYPIKINKR